MWKVISGVNRTALGCIRSSVREENQGVPGSKVFYILQINSGLSSLSYGYHSDTALPSTPAFQVFLDPTPAIHSSPTSSVHCSTFPTLSLNSISCPTPAILTRSCRNSPIGPTFPALLVEKRGRAAEDGLEDGWRLNGSEDGWRFDQWFHYTSALVLAYNIIHLQQEFKPPPPCCPILAIKNSRSAQAQPTTTVADVSFTVADKPYTNSQPTTSPHTFTRNTKSRSPTPVEEHQVNSSWVTGADESFTNSLKPFESLPNFKLDEDSSTDLWNSLEPNQTLKPDTPIPITNLKPDTPLPNFAQEGETPISNPKQDIAVSNLSLKPDIPKTNRKPDTSVPNLTPVQVFEIELESQHAVNLLLQGSPRGVTLLKQLSRRGSSVASFYLGMAYEQGYLVNRSLSAARKHYQRAADAGNPEAEYNLAVFYTNGWGGVKDTVKAKELLQSAAEGGVEQARIVVGSDIDVTVDVSTSKSDSKSTPKSAQDIYRLGRSFEDLGEMSVALDMYTKAEEAGCFKARRARQRLSSISS